MLSKTRKWKKRGSCEKILVNKKPEAKDERDVGCSMEEGNQRRGQGKGGWIWPGEEQWCGSWQAGWRLGQGLHWMDDNQRRAQPYEIKKLFCLDSAEVNDCDISVP